MTDINRLLASLKRRSAHAKEFGHDVLFVKLEDIDALVEALEKAQQRNGELETYSKVAIEFREAARDENRHLKLELEIAEKRIAALESRIVKLPKRSVGEVMHMSGFSLDYAEGWCAGNDNAIHEMRVAGVNVIEGEQNNG